MFLCLLGEREILKVLILPFSLISVTFFTVFNVHTLSFVKNLVKYLWSIFRFGLF